LIIWIIHIINACFAVFKRKKHEKPLSHRVCTLLDRLLLDKEIGTRRKAHGARRKGSGELKVDRTKDKG
jgi:hypothetical protein